MAKRIISLMMVVALSISMFMLVGCKKEGKIYTLQEAYDMGLIDRDDLMHISYFLRNDGKVSIRNANGEIERIEFTPKIDKPKLSDLDEKIKEDMKDAHYRKHKDFFDGLKNPKIDRVVGFLGKYKKAYAVTIQSTLDKITGVIIREEVAGVLFSTMTRNIQIFAYN